MDGVRPPIGTGGATARAAFGGGLTAPGPYGRRVLRPAGAGLRRALPWGTRAASRALPVSGGGVRRAGGLLGGLRSRRRAAEAERQSGRAATATGPGSGSRFGRPRLARSQAAREPPPPPPPRAGEKLRSPGPGRREKWARGEPCAGTHRGRDGASLTWRARRGRDNGASRRSRGPRLSVCAPGAVGVDMRVLRLSPAAPGGGPVSGNTASPRLPVEGTGAAPFQQNSFKTSTWNLQIDQLVVYTSVQIYQAEYLRSVHFMVFYF